ncbi:MAG TPA: efflux RND transporter permease subunit [Steroidobacteraceae bacterium]|jgi:multidrug efflux pump|nr:efflux RND transporter permease subunit [Steroidobacteraceae bacterium]
MKLTDLFIRRPVLAIVISLFIFVLGMRAIFGLSITQYPQTESANITINTTYYGADAATVAGFITQPLEAAIAQAQGIEYLSSSSTTGSSSITATLRLNYDSNRALTEISAQVNSVRNQLPPQSQQPVVAIDPGNTTAAMYIGFFTDTLPPNGVTDYLIRVVQPKLDSIPGVQSATVQGARVYALRAWLDPQRMAARNVAAGDVYNALAANNYLTAVGSTKGQMVSVDLTADTDLHSLDGFRQLIVRQQNNTVVRLSDVATVELGAEDYDSGVTWNGRHSVFLAVQNAPKANALQVAQAVREALPAIQAQLPSGMRAEVVYDTTMFVRSAIREVIKTLGEALLIVTVVIFLFLGTVRATAVPMVAMPLSLVGTFFMMLALGYSINLLTLLALVLAIGLVVDDAIIVVENFDRHLKAGESPVDSALFAARELGGPILAMTVVLVAAYLPIGFQGGLTGALFTQFAFTLAASVTVSAVIALTLSPMLCSKLFRADQEEGKFAQQLDRNFTRVRHLYQRILAEWLMTWQVLVGLGAAILCLTVYLFATAHSELAPAEDQGVVVAQIQGAPNATYQQMEMYSKQMFDAAASLPEYYGVFQRVAGNGGFGGVLFTPWGERKRTAAELQEVLQGRWSRIAGAQIAAFQQPALPGSSGLPLQFVITTTEPSQNLYEVTEALLARARASGLFFFINSDMKIDKPQATLALDREMVGDMGLTQQDVGASLGAALGGGYVNYFSISGRSYKVIPQVLQKDRLNPAQVLDYYVHAGDGSLIQAATLAHISTSTVPESINHFQQLNAATISGTPAVAQDTALKYLSDTLQEIAPSGYTADYAGQSRQFMLGSGNFTVTLFFALIIVYLALAAQFESFRDPVVILVSVPMALFGAMLFINAGASSLNIYTQVGLVTLLGLISKHGILIVQFANELQKAGRSKMQAIVEAAAVRLRPIVMTTAAMVLGVVPLVIASGAGAAGRRSMGIVLFTGLSIGTLFTLFVVPAMYILLGAQHVRDGEAPKLDTAAL